MIALKFTEWMDGFAALGPTDPAPGYEAGKRAGTRLAMRLTLSTEDLDAFIRSEARLLQVDGEISFAPLGGVSPVKGTVNQLIDVDGDPRHKTMPYRLVRHEGDGRRS